MIAVSMGGRAGIKAARAPGPAVPRGLTTQSGSENQERQHHLEKKKKCRIAGPTPGHAQAPSSQRNTGLGAWDSVGKT